tara:strand:+ start:843 stop:2213 length:1371 start_codon:yes stop_codon:yes gene_type:complete
LTVSSLNTKNSYNGDGSATSFAYQFPIHSTAELTVIERSANGTETIKSLGSHYSISDNGAAGGNVVFGSAPASGVTVVLLRNTNLTQEVDYIENDAFPAETHEAAIDKLTLQIQEAQEEIDRSLKISRTNTMTSTEFTNSATDRANKILAFDTSGELSVAQELGSNRGNWSASTAYAVRDIVKDTSTNNIFMAKTAHTSSGSQPLTTNTDSAKWDLLVDAASATTSQNAAAASATAASNSETAAASSASTALSHKNDAETAKTAAETAFDNFDDRFLGSKGSDPTVDNDGNALLTGSIYYSTASSEMKVYTGSAWDTLKPSSANQTAINTAVSNIAAIQAASTNATNAANSATAAASSASSAATALSSANTALSSAQAAQTAAELALDQFDDIYLGSKSTDPSTDNDGDALTQGDLYHNSSSNNLRIYHNGAWQDVAVSTTGFAQSGFSIAMSVAL